MTGSQARRKQLYGNSLLLSPISFEDRAAAVASIIGKPCKALLYVKIEVVESRNKFVRQLCNRPLSVCSEPCSCASTKGTNDRIAVWSLPSAAISRLRNASAKARNPKESPLPARRCASCATSVQSSASMASPSASRCCTIESRNTVSKPCTFCSPSKLRWVCSNGQSIAASSASDRPVVDDAAMDWPLLQTHRSL